MLKGGPPCSVQSRSVHIVTQRGGRATLQHLGDRVKVFEGLKTHGLCSWVSMRSRHLRRERASRCGHESSMPSPSSLVFGLDIATPPRTAGAA